MTAPRLAPDTGLPQRDALLDGARLGPRLSSLLAADGRLEVERVERLRVTYRVGRSMTLVLRVHADGGVHVVSARAFGEGNAAGNFERARSAAREPGGRLRPVAYAEELETVFWTFPHDRRIESLALLDRPNGELDRLLGARCTPRLVAYVPEKAATARCVDDRGRAHAYVKVYGDGAGARADAVHRALAAALAATGGPVRVPRALAFDPDRRALALEPIDGETLAAADRPGGLRALGAALATLHRAPPPPGLGRLDRTTPARLDHAAETIGAVRPDLAGAAVDLAGALVASFDDGEERVCLHGDAHGKNAIAGPGGIALIDLDQAALGPPAADLGSVLAGLRHRRCLGSLSRRRERELVAELLGGYASVRGLPGAQSLAWHTAAALLAERALRAVSRVRPDGLARLDDLVAAGRRECPRRRRRPAPRPPRAAGSRPPVLMHCQHTVGLGHLSRSLALAGALAERFAVVVLCGGEIPAHVAAPAGVEVVQMPPLARDRDGAIVSPDRRRSAERATVLRRRAIDDAVRAVAPAAIVVELFPFGRRAFTGEILSLIEAARARPGGPALVACSLRDILVGRGARQAAFDERASRLANANLDAVLVHADPRFARLEESFRPRTPLRVPVHYTGFVAGPRPVVGPAPGRRSRTIVVSAGGGSVGEPLLRAALDAQPRLWLEQRMPMRAIVGPFLPEAAWRELRARAAGRPGLELRRAVADLGAELRAAAVSISQCGYNTALDILRARVPALVVPYRAPGEDEQARRAERLAELGAVRVLDPAALGPAALADGALALAGTEAPAPDLDLDGAAASAELLSELVAGAVPAASGVPA